MNFDEENWKFPAESLSVSKIALCLRKHDEGIEAIGFRIECNPLMLPNINYGYEKESEENPHIDISLAFPFESLDAFVGQKADLGEPVENCGDDLGSVYLFGAHNPVGWKSIEFGKVIEGRIEVDFDLYFDFDFEDRIGGCFRHSISGLAEIEKRWEL